jgi:hypothetical protein
MSIDLVKGKVNTDKFNDEFEKTNAQERELENQREIKKLQDMNEVIYKKKINEMTLHELVLEWKKSLLDMLNDL